MLGVAVDERGVPRFSVCNLRHDPAQAAAVNRSRAEMVHAFYGWESYERMELEYKLSVAPFMHLLNHHERINPRQLIETLLANPTPPLEPTHAHRESFLSPIDVFSLPFRHLTTHETIEQLSFNIGLR